MPSLHFRNIRYQTENFKRPKGRGIKPSSAVGGLIFSLGFGPVGISYLSTNQAAFDIIFFRVPDQAQTPCQSAAGHNTGDSFRQI